MAARDDRALICFVHVERAGGTTLQHLFRYNHPFTYVMLTPWAYWPNEPGAEFTPEEARLLLRAVPGAWGFGGHATRSYLDYAGAVGRPVRFVTWLRDPLRRYVSHFNYQREVMGIPWSLDDFLEEPRFRNFVVRRIAGREDLDEARRALAEDYAFVGLTERFDESLLLFRQRLDQPDFDLRYQRMNASPNPGYQRDPRLSDPAVQERIRENNALDLELFAFVRDELFPRYVAEYPGDLAAEAEALRRSCEGFRFRRRRRLLWAGWRFLYYRPIEAWAHHRHHGRPG